MVLDTTCSVLIDYLEDSFAIGYKVSLECLVRVFVTVHQTYVFEEAKRSRSFDDNYDIGNLLMLVVHHAIALRVRRPDTASLMIEDNLKLMFKMFAIESKVNQILDINSLYLTWLIMRDRKKDFEKRRISLTMVSSEGHMFLKAIIQYILDIDFDIRELDDNSEGNKFFLEDLIQEKLFGPFLSLDLSPISESEDFLDSIFIWEYYKGEVRNEEYLLLKFIMILQVFNEIISVIHDIADMFRLQHGQPTTRNVTKIIHDSMAKISLKIFRILKNWNFDALNEKLAKSSPHTVAFVKELILGVHTKFTDLAKEIPFFGAFLYFTSKEGADLSLSRVLTSSVVTRLEIDGITKLQQDFLADIEKSRKKLCDPGNSK